MKVNAAQRMHGDDGIDIENLLSGASGTVAGKKQLLARARDTLLNLELAWKMRGGRLDKKALSIPARSILVLGLYASDGEYLLPGAVEELEESRHDVNLVLGALGASRPELAPITVADHLSGGKFENLNELLKQVDTADVDWFLIVDDDVTLPRRFLDRFIYLIEKHHFKLAQPAQSLTSHAAWDVCRRQPRTVLRQTRFVEIGPVTAVSRDAAQSLMPFPPLKMGWGLDLHWSAIAMEHGWKIGVVDATPVEHSLRRPASGYSRREAVDEARSFLSAHPHITREEASEPVARHTSW